MKVDTKMLARATVLANTGAMMAGAAYNGPHSANGIASLFIATGQDEANVVESHAGMLSHELLDNVRLLSFGHSTFLNCCYLRRWYWFAYTKRVFRNTRLLWYWKSKQARRNCCSHSLSWGHFFSLCCNWRALGE